MKKILLAVTAIIISTGAFAQDDSSKTKMSPPDINDNQGQDMMYNKNKNPEGNPVQNQQFNINPNTRLENNPDSVMNQKTTESYPDGYLMRNGIMMTVISNRMKMMEKDVTLENGTIVMNSGYYQKKNGSKTRIREGEEIDLAGNLIQMR